MKNLPRYSIASILAVIAIVAVALAALRTPSYLWANVTSSLALGTLVVAVINVIYSREGVRAYWVGFSLCGGIYFAVCTLPGLHDSVCPRLATEVALDLLYPHVSPASAAPGFGWIAEMVQVRTPGAPAIDQTVSGVNGSVRYVYSSPTPMGSAIVVPEVPASQWAAWNEPDRTIGVGYPIGTVPLCSSEAFRRIGHAMFTLVFAVLGGTFARHRYRISVTRTPDANPSL
jgi:hypothetical protein